MCVRVCVCVIEAQTLVFNMLVSSVKGFISSVKRVCSMPTTAKRVHLKRDSHLEVNSRDYLIASDKRVPLLFRIRLEPLPKNRN